MKPSWFKPLSEVLKHPTLEVSLTSEKTGNTYTAEVIKDLKVLSTGVCEETPDGKFKYSVVDQKNNLEYAIKAPNKVEPRFGTTLVFKIVRGGPTNNGSWFSADSVEVASNG